MNNTNPLPGEGFDMLFPSQKCGLCKMDKRTCGCAPTDDGPGQPEEERKGGDHGR